MSACWEPGRDRQFAATTGAVRVMFLGADDLVFHQVARFGHALGREGRACQSHVHSYTPCHDTSLLEVRMGMDADGAAGTQRVLPDVRLGPAGMPELREP